MNAGSGGYGSAGEDTRAGCVCPPCRCAAPSSRSQGQNRHSGRNGARGRSLGRSRVRAVARARGAALSPNTVRTYATGWNSFCSWADAQGVDVSSAGSDDFQGWLVDLAAEGKRPSTLRTYRAAVVHRYSEWGGANPARDPQVGRVLSGLRRQAAQAGYVPKQAAPLRHHHIDLIAETAFEPRNNQPGGRLETPEQAARRALVDIALVSVAHDGLLRCSELLAIRWGDVVAAENSGGTLIYVRRSKTDQTANGAYIPVSQFASKALERIKPPNADPDALVFDMSAGTVARRLKAVARTAGIDAENISTHSPRVGMAQDLAAAGFDMAAIMVAGRWSTPAMVALYTRRLAAADSTIAKHLQTRQTHPSQQRPRNTNTTPQAA
ncbi:MAG: tyrosine-type recombinase/integrase [Acidimicrobiia bacterium]|nr:tyrosine-type recombinase/integrase [Acidimicrobiia bacterium]